MINNIILVSMLSSVLTHFSWADFLGVIALLGVLCFIWGYSKANKLTNNNRDKIRKTITDQASLILPMRKYSTANAGSGDEYDDGCIQTDAIDVDYCCLRGNNGKILDLTLYYFYIVKGDSMKYAGLNDGDLILVPKYVKFLDINQFPFILVIRCRRKSKSGAELYKVRRAWYRGSFEDDLENVAKEIVKSDKFQKLTTQKGYKGEDWMLTDLLENRVKSYRDTYAQDNVIPIEYQQIILSTTFDTKKEEIHFSIHPVTSIVGMVSESYTLPKLKKQ